MLQNFLRGERVFCSELHEGMKISPISPYLVDKLETLTLTGKY